MLQNAVFKPVAKVYLSAFALANVLSNVYASDQDWRTYGGNRDGDRFSSLSEITRENVQTLEQAWRFDIEPGGLQTQPLVVDGVFFAYTTDQDVIALDATTGEQRWRFDTQSHSWQPVRGLSVWQEGQEKRLFASADHWLYAIDPDTGKPVTAFGEAGRIDLRSGLSDSPENLAVYMTTPGVVFEDLIITGFRTTETGPAAPGRVRAFDVHTGALRWQFNLLPNPGERGADTWPEHRSAGTGGANSWAGMVLDAERAMVFVPTGSATDDFYGGDRPGNNLFANSLVALDARTGNYRWHFQGVHHDIWDRDFASPPVLLNVVRDGRSVAAVAQASKQGFVFVFERDTGTPLFQITETAVPTDAAPGEQPASTQPVPVLPAPFARQRINADQLSSRTEKVNSHAREQLADMQNGALFTPLAVDKPTIVMPGFDGGAEWGGQAVDRSTGLFVVNSNDVAWHAYLVSPHAVADKGEALFLQHCASCHGVDRSGSPPEFPALTGLSGRINDFDMIGLIKGGRGRMPGIPSLSRDDILLISGWLAQQESPDDLHHDKSVAPFSTSGYVFSGFRKFLDADGYPAVAPPWGTLNAIDLNTGEYRWRRPLGFYPELAAEGLENTGTENYGGPIVTSTGLVFIGATIFDRRFRAFDIDNGQLLWQAELPYAGTATPITYAVGGHQYVAIACSGARDRRGPKGAAYVSFRLPTDTHQ